MPVSRHPRRFEAVFLAAVATASLVLGGLTVAQSASAADLPDGQPAATAPVDAQSAATDSQATGIATEFNHDVIVEDRTTPTEQVQALPDGSFTLTESTVPVRVSQAGQWVPIDNDLKTSKSGLLVPKASTGDVAFGGGRNDTLARIQTSTGSWLTETSPFGDLPTPTVDGATATYSDVLPDVDLQLTATAQGMSEVLVINTPAAATNPELASVDFEVDASSVKLAADGIATATTKDGSKVIATTPVWWDSSNGSDASGSAGQTNPQPVPQTVDDSTITLDAQAAATTPGVQYPVYVDPDWTGGLQTYTYVDSGYPTGSYWMGNNAGGQQRTGYITGSGTGYPDNGPHTTRSLWQVDTSGVAGKHILAARFSVTETWSYNCTATEVDLYWSGGISSATTWNNQPNVLQLLDSATVAHGPSGCPSAGVSFNAVPGVQAAANQNAGALTLELRAANESSVLSWKRFAQSASITITYNTVPNVPSSLAVAAPSRVCGTSAYPALLNGTQAVSLQASISDADGGNVSGNFYLGVVGSSATPTLYSAPFGAQGNQQVTISSGTLTAGTTYSWYVQASDGIEVSASSTTCYFTVKNTNPALPTITAGAAAATVGAPMTFQFGSAPADKVWVFAYWWAVGGVTSPSPAVPVSSVTISGPLPACGSALKGVTFVCPDSNGNSPVVTAAPIDDTSTLWVASYDAAGNVSKNAAGTSSATGSNVITSADSANVSFTKGHGWITDGLSSPIPSTIVDSNSTTGTALTSRHDLTLPAGTTTNAVGTPLGSPPATPVFSFQGFTELDRYYSGADHGGYIESQAPAGYNLESALGQLAALVPSGQQQPANAAELYSCARTNGDEMTTPNASCEGVPGTTTPLGYIWTSLSGVPAGLSAVGLYRCLVGGDHFDSLSTTCEGQTVDAFLGYLVTLNPTSTGQVIDTTKSFTASAWLYPSNSQVSGRTYAAISESGATNSGFSLLDSNGTWLFCVSDQSVPATRTCALGPTAAIGKWSYVTGIYDSVNHQLRVLVGYSTTPVGVDPYTAPSGASSVTGSLLIGSGLASNAPAYQWNGQIDDPTVFQGVLDTNQLLNLYYQSAPQ